MNLDEIKQHAIMDLTSNNLNSPKAPPSSPTPDVGYVVMPTLARETMVEQQVQKEQVRAARQPLKLNKKWFYIGGGGALVVLLTVLGFIYFAGKKEPPPPPTVQTRLPKVWLKQYFDSEICSDAQICGDDADGDSDGLTNYNEFKEGTKPKENDTDDDGLADGDEINIYKTDPGLQYTDRREIAQINDYNDAVGIANSYDPLTPGIKMTESRLQQIANDTTKYGLHEPTITTLQTLKNQGFLPVAKNVTVFIEQGKFNPEKAIINKSDTIIWLNKDQALHMIASDPHPAHTILPGLVSPELTRNQTFSFKFENAGSFTYHDHLNPSVKGTVEVK